MRNRSRRPAVPVPSEGGSYTIDKKGNLMRTEHTAGPLDPDHEKRRGAGRVRAPEPSGPAVPSKGE